MNKKQLVVAWAMGIIISITMFVGMSDYGSREVMAFCMPVLIIGGLLIYTLRDKKK